MTKYTVSLILILGYQVVVMNKPRAGMFIHMVLHCLYINGLFKPDCIDEHSVIRWWTTYNVVVRKFKFFFGKVECNYYVYVPDWYLASCPVPYCTVTSFSKSYIIVKLVKRWAAWSSYSHCCFVYDESKYIEACVKDTCLYFDICL